MSEVYLPLLWFEEEAVMPSYLAWLLQLLLVIMNTPVVDIVFSVLLVLGLLGAFLVFVYHRRKAKNTQRSVFKS